ncbi:MAG: carbon-nitrogen hydrolase family protein [Acidobacteria bacterium]|nr:carbon-nitrogen hydrolase family protein [Acidobacteriota bacterium]
MKPLLLLLFTFGLWAGESTSFTMAGIRVIPDAWDKQANLKRIEKYTREAVAKGAQVVVTPEGFLEGYVANNKRQPDITRERLAAVGERIDGPLLTRLKGLAKELRIHLVVCFAERRGDKMFNSLAIFTPQGEVAMSYHKSHNAEDEPFNDTGTQFPVVDTPLGRWGTLICYDRQLPETSRILAIKGAQLLIVPAWGSFGDMNTAMMRTRAFENGVWVAFVHPQQFLLIDPRGKIVAQDNGEKGDQLVFGRVTLDDRIGKAAIRSRKPQLYGEILK